MNSARRLDRCNKCGEPLRAGICSDEVNCLLDRVAAGIHADHRLDRFANRMAGRTHIGRMAQPVEVSR